MPAPRKYDDEIVARVLQMYSEGAKISRISEETGVPIGSVQAIRTRHGLSSRQRQRTTRDQDKDYVQWLLDRLEVQAKQIVQLEAEVTMLRTVYGDQ